MRCTLPVASLLFASVVTGIVADDAAVDLRSIDRTITREPEYKGQPHYALFVFGPQREHRSWLVIDGDSTAYIDRNGNGDLTEPEDRVELDVEASEKLKFSNAGAFIGMHQFPLGEIHGTRLNFHLWVRNPGFDRSQEQNEVLRDWYRELDAKQWVNGSLMRIAEDGSQSQNPLLLTVRPEDAQIARFGGPITVGLKWDDRQRLEPWPKQFVFDVHLGYRNLLAKDCDHRGFGMTRFTTAEVPSAIEPVAIFEFSETSDGKPLAHTVRLDERCCGDTFYATLTLPKQVTGGTAKVTVQVKDWIGEGAELAEFEVPINQELSSHSEAVYVMFHQPDIETSDAVNALRKRGVDVLITPAGLLHIHDNGKPTYIVRLVRSDAVRQICSALGEGTPHADELSQCNTRFEISFIETEKVLQDQSVLTQIQTALQELTGGYAYRTWEKRLVPPQ